MAVKRSLLTLLVGIFAAAGIMVLAQPAYALQGVAICTCKGDWDGVIWWTSGGDSLADVKFTCNSSVARRTGRLPSGEFVPNVVPDDHHFVLVEAGGDMCEYWTSGNVSKAAFRCARNPRGDITSISCRTRLKSTF